MKQIPQVHHFFRVLAIFCLSGSVALGAAPDSYQSVLKDGKPSPSFTIQHRGKLCLVLPRIAAVGDKDAAYEVVGRGKLQLSKGKAFRQRFTNIYIFGDQKTEGDIAYSPEFELRAGDKVVAIGPDGKKDPGTILVNPANGGVYSPAMGPVRIMTMCESKLLVADRVPRGCPVFLKESGQLIGITASRPQIDRFSFETLCLPSGAARPKEKMVSSLAGYKFVTPQKKSDFYWLFPARAWEENLGFDLSEEGKTKKWSKAFEDHSNIVRDDVPFLYRMDYRIKEEEGVQVTESQMSGLCNRIGDQYLKAEQLFKLLVGALGKPVRMSTEYEYGELDSLVLYWRRGDRGILFSLSYGAGSVRGSLTVRKGPTSSLVKKYMVEGKLVEPPRDIDAVFKEWQGLPDTLFRKKPAEK